MAKFVALLLTSATMTCLACSSEPNLPAPSPAAIVPDQNDNTKDIRLTIKGENFYSIPVRRLSEDNEFSIKSDFAVTLYRRSDSSATPETVALSDIKYVDDRTITGMLLSGATQGQYGVKVTSPAGLSGAKDDVLQIVAPDTPADTDTSDTDTSDSEIDTDFGSDPLTHYCGVDEVCDEACAADLCAFGCISKHSCTYQCNATQCAMNCKGIGNCDLTCGANTCELGCNGIGDCSINCDSGDCTAVNNNTGTLRVDCSAGECNMACNGTGPCIMSCSSENCNVTCSGESIACSDSVYVCNTSCP